MTTNHFIYTTASGLEVEVTYTHHKGFKGNLVDPGEPDAVEIQSIVPDVPLEDMDDLAEEAFQHYADYCADMEEYRAEARKEDSYGR